MLLRGHDAFCVWSPKNEMAEEIRAAYEVYIESLKYNDFILNGKLIFWDVPEKPETVISGIRLKNKLLIMRTDFDESKEIRIKINNKILTVSPVSIPTILNIN